jgi:hypothetical protein
MFKQLFILILLSGCAQGVEDTVFYVDAGKDISVDVHDAAKDTSETGGIDASTDSGMDALMDADAGNSCVPFVSGVCNPNQQCGCGINQNCVPDDYGYASCIMSGNTPDYSWCSRNEDCRAGAGCISNICHPFCDNNCGPGGICQGVASSINTMMAIANACLQTCDPVHPQNPDPGLYPCGPGLG